MGTPDGNANDAPSDAPADGPTDANNPQG
jgi:hypothetical protein